MKFVVRIEANRIIIGQSVFADPVSGRDVIVYHYVKLSDPIGGPSYLGINYLDFSSGWPVVVS